MHPGFYFVLAMLGVAAMICGGFAIQAIRNPRRVWDRQHARDVKGGEPTDESLVRIRRSGWIAIILMPIFFPLAAYMTWLKAEKQQEELARFEQAQRQRRPPMDDRKPSANAIEPFRQGDRDPQSRSGSNVDQALRQAEILRKTVPPEMIKAALVQLKRVGQIKADAGDPIADLAVEGQYAYLSLPGELRIVDISEPAQPRVVGTLERKDATGAVSVSGRYAYVADEKRLQVVDVSNPAALPVVGACDLGFEIGSAAIQGEYAYVTDGGSVLVIDISDPAAPREVGRGAVDCGQGLTVAGEYAFLPCDVDGMRIVDISDPRAPKQVGSFTGSAGAEAIAVAGKHAYITGGEDAVALSIVDVSNPRSPRRVGKYGDWLTGGVAIGGKYAYLASGNLHVLDISNPAAPKEIGFFDVDEDPVMFAWRVVVAGDYVYASGEGEQGFSILRAVWSPPENPR